MKKNLKKAISISLAITVLLSTFAGLSILSLAEASVENVTRPDKSVVSSNDYDDTTLDYGSWNYNFKNIAGDLTPKTVTGKDGNTANKALAYKHFHYGMGFIIPGHDYNSGKLSDVKDSIKVESGKTYRVDFDYKVDTDNGALGTDLTIGLTVHSPSIISDIVDQADIGKAALWSPTTGLWSHDVQKTTELTFAKNTQPDSKWKHFSKEISIDDTKDLNTYNTLMIYIQLGNQATSDYTYIDNVTVSVPGIYNEKDISDIDYEYMKDTNIYNGVGGIAWAKYQGVGDTARIATGDSIHSNAILYRQNVTGRGQILLGYDYVAGFNKDDTSLLKAEKGKTYRITFDYRVKGNIGVSDLELGLAAGTPLTNVQQTRPSSSSESDKELPGFSKTKLIKTFKSKSTPDQNWKTISTDISFSVDQNFGNGNYLMIYCKNGNQSEANQDGIMFDNVKVQEISYIKYACLSNKQLSYNDYSTAINKDFDQFIANLRKYSSDGTTAKDPDDNNNIVLAYSQCQTGLGLFFPGENYKDIANIGDLQTLISADAGKTYKVDFKYKLKGKVSGDLSFGMAIAKKVTVDGTISAGQSNYYNKDFTVDHKVFSTFEKGKTYDDTQWKNATFYYTVPTDLDIPNDMNTLVLYTIGGGTSKENQLKCYIDDVMVTEQACVGIDYHYDDTVNKTYNSDGNIGYIPKTDDNNQSIKWFTDPEHKTPFISNDYKRAEEYYVKDLYGVRDYSNSPIIMGDADMNGKIESSDLVTLRKALLNDSSDINLNRADVNNSGDINIKDLIRLEKISSGIDLSSLVKVGDTSIKDFKVETGLNSEVVTSRITSIQNIIGNNSNSSKKISMSIDKSLSENCYIFKIENDDNITIIGQNDNAVAAATEMLLGYIKAGISINSSNSLEFVYTGDNI